MKYLPQLGLIFLFSFLGELCAAALPFRLPAAIYGMALLAAALLLKLIRLDWVREAGSFLTGLLPLLFMVPVVGLLDHWEAVVSSLWAIAAIIVLSTAAVFGIAGLVTQKILEKEEPSHDPDHR